MNGKENVKDKAWGMGQRKVKDPMAAATVNLKAATVNPQEATDTLLNPKAMVRHLAHQAHVMDPATGQVHTSHVTANRQVQRQVTDQARMPRATASPKLSGNRSSHLQATADLQLPASRARTANGQ